MQKWVLVSIITAIALAIGLGPWITYNIFKGREVVPQTTITKENAIELVAEKYPFLKSTRIEPEFGFLKYNGTHNGNPQFMLYQADPYSKAISKKSDSIIFYEGEYGPIVFAEGEYFSSEINDRFVWIFFDDNVPNANQYYVDANSGELIGMKRGGGYCHGCDKGK